MHNMHSGQLKHNAVTSNEAIALKQILSIK